MLISYVCDKYIRWYTMTYIFIHKQNVIYDYNIHFVFTFICFYSDAIYHIWYTPNVSGLSHCSKYKMKYSLLREFASFYLRRYENWPQPHLRAKVNNETIIPHRYNNRCAQWASCLLNEIYLIHINNVFFFSFFLNFIWYILRFRLNLFWRMKG